MDKIIVQESPRTNSTLIEVIVNQNGVQRVKFPDVQQLRNTDTQRVIITTIRVIPPNVLTNAINTNAVNAPLTELQKIAVVLYAEGWEKGYQIPILALNDFASAANPYRFQTTRLDNWRNVDWTQCYLQYANGQVSAGATYAVLLEVEYLKFNDKGLPIK